MSSIFPVIAVLWCSTSAVLPISPACAESSKCQSHGRRRHLPYLQASDPALVNMVLTISQAYEHGSSYHRGAMFIIVGFWMQDVVL
jgi:hypothetical protein